MQDRLHDRAARIKGFGHRVGQNLHDFSVRKGKQRGEHFTKPVGIAAAPCLAGHAERLEQGGGASARCLKFSGSFRCLKACPRLVLAAGAMMGPDGPERAAGHRVGDHQAQRDRWLTGKACLRGAMSVQQDILCQRAGHFGFDRC